MTVRGRPLVLSTAVVATVGFLLPLPALLDAWPAALAPWAEQWIAWPVWLFPVLFVVACLAAPLFPRLPFFAPVLCRNPHASGCVALTFDDGPSPETTPRLLRLLETLNAEATFFIVGRKARQHPDLVKAILTGGHEIANHTLSHDVLLALRSTANVREEVAECSKILAGFGAVSPLLRAPVGIINPRIARVAREQGLTLVNWSVRAGDRGNRNTLGMGMRLAGRIRGGDIVLLHDRPPEDQTADTWVAEIGGMIALHSARGIRFATVTQLMQVGRR
jgi:peptidoglycan/xylan/chitin deacetylase (PgdA/CDA1 family)